MLNAVLVSDSPAPGDAELVERFVVARDQAAFTELVRRHSAVVLGVCRRVLRDTHDIDDVFQATFLVFVRDADRVRKRQSLASWLYGVAYRISLRVARKKQRRRETTLVDENVIDDDTLGRLTDRHDQQLVDIELNALPERYRQPLVLRYLSGHSTDEIATELGTTVGAVEGLLKRGKDELRRRLLQRGITLGVALAAIQTTQQAVQAAATESLIDTTIQAGLAWNAGPDTPTSDVISDHAVELAAKEIIAMTTTTKTALAVGLTLGGIVAGMAGANALTNHSTGNVEAAGLVTTMSVSRPVMETVELATLTETPAAQNIDSNGAAKTFETKAGTGADSSEGLGGTGLASGAVRGRGSDFVIDGGGGGSGTFEGAKSDSVQDTVVRWDKKRRSPQTLKIEKALHDSTEVAFTDQPLKQALDYLEDVHHIEILIDQAALSDEGISTDQPVNLVLSGVSLKSALRLILDQLQLDYIIKNEVMMITTRTKADEMFETRVYNHDLLEDYTPKELMEIILSTVAPDSWNVTASVRSFHQGNQASAQMGPMGIGKLSANAVRPAVEGSVQAANGPTGALGGHDDGTMAGAGAGPMAGGGGGGGMGGSGGMGGGGGGFLGDSGEGVIRATPTTLVIRQTQRVHDEIVELLNQLK